MSINTRFFIKNNLPLSDIISISEAVPNKENITQEVLSVNTLQDGNVGDISFFHNKKYLDDFKNSKSSFIFCLPRFVPLAPKECVVLQHENPYFGYAKSVAKMYSIREEYIDQENIIDQTAKISNYARIGNNVQIGKNCIVEDGVVIKNGVILGENTIVKSNSVIGYGVKIGSNTAIDYNVVIEFATIGNNCHIYSGVKIGQRGYGFAVDKKKLEIADVPQLGCVDIADFVDIGSNTTVDRGTINDTTIDMYTKIDNLVQIGHNVKIGKACFIVSQVGLAGGVTIGDFSSLAGQVGVAGHLHIGTGATIMAQSGVMSDIPDNRLYVGSPAVPGFYYGRIAKKLGLFYDPKDEK